MPSSKSSAIDDILSKHEDQEHDEPQGRPGRRAGAARQAQPKAPLRNTQAWRAIEDMKESQRLDRHLKEVYEDGESK